MRKIDYGYYRRHFDAKSMRLLKNHQCPVCGNVFYDGALICGSCGHEFQYYNEFSGFIKICICLLFFGLFRTVTDGVPSFGTLADDVAGEGTVVHPTASAEEGSIGTLTVNTKVVNVRDKPSVDGDIITVISEGDESYVYDVFEENDYTWYKISMSEECWVANNGEWLDFKQKD